MKKISVLLVALFLVIQLNYTTAYALSSDINGPDIIHKEANQVFTIGDLLSLYDRDVFIEKDDFTGYGNIPGEYHVLLFQGDKTKDVTIVVVDRWANLENSSDLLFVSDYKDIYVSNDRILSLYEILYFIYPITGYIQESYQFRYEEITNTYHTQELNDDGSIEVGTYDLSFRLTYFSGFQEVYHATITTKEIIINGVIIEAPPTTLDQIMSFVPWIVVIGLLLYAIKHKKKRGFIHD